MYVMDEIDKPVGVRGAASTVKSARRVLEVLEYFAQGVKSATVMEIANALAYPQSSTSVLLATLAQLDYVRFDAESRTYSPTLRVMLLGSSLQDQLFGGGSVVRVMEQLRQRTGQTVMIGLRQGIHVRFIFSILGRNPHVLRYPMGVLRPVCLSPVGKVLLARLPTAEVTRIARHANAQAQSPDHRTTVRDFLSEIEDVRRTGWAVSVDYPLPNRMTLAMELPSLPGQPAMGITVGGRKQVMAQQQATYLAEMRAACAQLQRTHARAARHAGEDSDGLQDE
jgi:DNA-binding IclR family transcriptional regulator